MIVCYDDVVVRWMKRPVSVDVVEVIMKRMKRGFLKMSESCFAIFAFFNKYTINGFV